MKGFIKGEDGAKHRLVWFTSDLCDTHLPAWVKISSKNKIVEIKWMRKPN